MSESAFAAAAAHNANPGYRRAEYPPLVTHRAEISGHGQETITVFYNVMEGECPRARLVAINAFARFRGAVITIAQARPVSTVAAAPASV